MSERRAAVLGATSLVGASLLPLLAAGGWSVVALSRNPPPKAAGDITWRQVGGGHLGRESGSAQGEILPNWISLAPIWILPDYFECLRLSGAKRVVALSSTSAVTKAGSSDPQEQATARRLIDSEDRLRAWAEVFGVEWIVLRPTLIYGHGLDHNVSEIARFVARFGFFPVVGAAGGLRQPVHAGDVAKASLAALQRTDGPSRVYDVSGGETLTYRCMVERVFAAMGRTPRIVSIPLAVLQIAASCMRLLPRYRRLSAAMAERMNFDLVFDHGDAMRDLDFAPRRFDLRPQDLPFGSAADTSVVA